MITPTNINLDELRKAAGAGDPMAQYALAAVLSGEGQSQEADRWLNASAEQGNGDALYTMATRCFNENNGFDEARSLLERAAGAGSTEAQRLRGVLYTEGFVAEPDWNKAISSVIGAARRGAPAAMREIAMLLFAIDPDDPDGAALIEHAAPGDAGAGIVAVRRAACGRRGADVDLAAKALQHLNAAGYPNTAALKAALDAQRLDGPLGENAAAKEPAKEPDWNRIIGLLDDVPQTPTIAPESVCEAPSARVFRGAFTLEECEYVIASSARLLAPSLIVDPQTGRSRQDEYRTSLTAVMAPVDLDLALVMITRRMAQFAGRPAENGEFLGVLCYGVGQEYRPHFDWLPPGPELERSGQRVTTALIILNDDYEGGETHFLSPDLKFKGATGDLLVFENVLADGKPDEATRHAGLPVTKGVKWLGSRWFREKKYTY
jgi:prolyl 4-hydroxylase